MDIKQKVGLSIKELRSKKHDIKIILNENIEQLIKHSGKVFMTTGDPRCQGFSTAGK